MSGKIGILTIVEMDPDNKKVPETYLGTIKSSNGVIISFKGLPLNEIAAMNGGTLKPEQLKTLAGGVGVHKDLVIDIDGKTFTFNPLFENQTPVNLTPNKSN